jgi:hypothetical protein
MSVAFGYATSAYRQGGPVSRDPNGSFHMRSKCIDVRDAGEMVVVPVNQSGMMNAWIETIRSGSVVSLRTSSSTMRVKALPFKANHCVQAAVLFPKPLKSGGHPFFPPPGPWHSRHFGQVQVLDSR